MASKELDWSAASGQTARVYRNLNNHKISVQLKVPGKGWLVAGHVTEAVLAGVTFHVSESGRQRVLQKRCKNVHAYAQATLIGAVRPDVEATIDLKYDPYVDTCFVQRHTQQPVKSCRYLVVRDNRVFVSADALWQPTNTKTAFQLKLVTLGQWVNSFAVPLAA